jgi:hypothetical protein
LLLLLLLLLYSDLLFSSGRAAGVSGLLLLLMLMLIQATLAESQLCQVLAKLGLAGQELATRLDARSRVG